MRIIEAQGLTYRSCWDTLRPMDRGESALRSDATTTEQFLLSSPSKPRDMWALAMVISLTALALSPVLVADYIGLDDIEHIINNPGLQRPSGSDLLGFWTKSYFSLYIPLTYSLWWLLASVASLFGTLRQTAWLFHAANLSLHLANSCLVFLTIRTLLQVRLGKQSSLNAARVYSISLLSALFFALHPIQVETAAWISECKGALSLLFGLIGIWNYYSRRKKYVTVVFFVLAMMSKPSAIIAPGILLLIDRILLGRNLKESAVMPVATCLLLLPVAVITKHLQPNLRIDFLPTYTQRIYIAMDALAFYVSKLFVPVSLALDYGRSPQYALAHVYGWRLGLSILVLLCALAIPAEAVFRLRPRSVWYSFVACGWAVFVLALLPTLGLIPFTFQDFTTVADHYAYVAVFGAALALVGVLISFRAAGKSLGITIAILILLAGLTFNQATKWRSTETLFAHTFEVNPQSYLGHFSIACDLFDRGRLDEGIAQTRKALEINPDFLSAQLSIGVAWIKKGEIKTAIDYYSLVLATEARPAGKHASLLAAMHNNLGMALGQVGRLAEAVQHFRKAVELDSQSFKGYWNLGDAALLEGQYVEAIIQYEHALALSPGNPILERQLARARSGARKVLFGGNR